MSESRNSPDHNSLVTSQEEWPEKMKLSQARKFLGVSETKISSLVSSGRLKYEIDPLDNRVKLVRRTDLEALMRQRTKIE
jgi:predicted XRE-type DNA-binding protein